MFIDLEKLLDLKPIDQFLNERAEIMLSHKEHLSDKKLLFSDKELLLRQSGRTTRIILQGIKEAIEGKTVYFRGPQIEISNHMVDKAKIYASKLGLDPNKFKAFHNLKERQTNSIVLEDHTCFSMP